MKSDQALYPQMHPYPRDEFEFGFECDETAEERGLKFLQWLVARPESRIAVVAHSRILHRTLSAIAKNQPANRPALPALAEQDLDPSAVEASSLASEEADAHGR
ncbi:g6971 [Coccomyxa viridis]|uniref:G6971 protein n=1 Tax=Coccomyxa viridis TaxID=1274662 RepID=A0ABP1FWN0_9CHLO